MLPITALAIIEDHYLIGEGTHIVVYERTTSKYVTRQKLLSNQSIHGFTDCLVLPYVYEIYAWGGRQIRKITITKTKTTDSIKVGPLIATADWLLQVTSFSSAESLGFEVLLLTAHNVLLGLRGIKKDGQ